MSYCTPDEAAMQEEEVQAQHADPTAQTVTTLKDLPLELHERILVEAIVSEVRERKLLRCGWKDSADRVAQRLRTVCPQWDNVLTTNSFRIRLHGVIDSFPSVEIHFKELNINRLFSMCCVAIAKLDDEYCILCHETQKRVVIKICDPGYPLQAKKIIKLPGVTVPWSLVACSVSNCLYVLHKTPNSIEIMRLSKEGEEFQVSSPWITCSTQLLSRMTVGADGCLIMFQGPAPSTMTVYNADGSLQRQMELKKRFAFVQDIIPKSNGNVIIVSGCLTEVDRDGNILYEYDTQAALPNRGFRAHNMCYAVDMHDKIIAVEESSSVRLLDSDFNQAEVKIDRYYPDYPARIRRWKHLCKLHYNRQRNEFIMLDCCSSDAESAGAPDQFLRILMLTETTNPEDAEIGEN